MKYIVINHTAVRPEVGAAAVARAQRARWPGIVGQYYITGDGQIQQTEPLDEAVSADLAWFYNGINIYVAGNFNEMVPAPLQLSALSQLVAWLMAKYGLDESAIRGASEFVATQSPGIQWMSGWRWKDMLQQHVRAILGKVGPQAKVGVRRLQRNSATAASRRRNRPRRQASRNNRRKPNQEADQTRAHTRQRRGTARAARRIPEQPARRRDLNFRGRRYVEPGTGSCRARRDPGTPRAAQDGAALKATAMRPHRRTSRRCASPPHR